MDQHRQEDEYAEHIYLVAMEARRSIYSTQMAPIVIALQQLDLQTNGESPQSLKVSCTTLQTCFCRKLSDMGEGWD